MRNRSNFILLLFFLLLFLVFRNWFTGFSLSAGDWDYQSLGKLQESFSIPFVWDYHLQNGFGGNNAHILGLSYYYNLSSHILSKYFTFSWIFIERFAWFWMFLGIAVASSAYLSWILFKNTKYILISIFIYLCNTYVLLLVSGGQMGVALAYAIAPLVFATFTKVVDEINWSSQHFYSYIKFSIIAGLVLALQVLFDIRIVYLTLIAIVLYVVFSTRFKIELKNILSILFNVFLIPSLIVALLHMFWLLPLVLVKVNPLDQLGAAYNTLEAVKFFSFATFENSLSLLHPNWPENIFGKVGFMKVEFLVLPILAYISLLFISAKDKVQRSGKILFFALLGLIGAFLAKGANEPFGFIYLWLFDHVPGFMMFRDPTKWYLLIALSYSILIPFSIYSIFDWLKTKNKFSIFSFQFSIKSKIFTLSNIFVLFILCSLLFLVRPVLLGEVGGTFKPSTIPQEYVMLEKFLGDDQKYFRILWFPTPQRFGYYSSTHPRVAAKNFFNEQKIDALLKDVSNKETEKVLQTASIKYIIVPYDSRKEIYLEDRKYNKKEYSSIIQRLDKISWLTRIDKFEKIAVYEIAQPKDHFWSSNSTAKIQYHVVNPTEYLVTITAAKKGDRIIFSDTYDPYWRAKNDSIKYQVSSIKYQGKFNSFVLTREGNYTFKVYYKPQKWVNIGLVISSLTFVFCLGTLVFLKKKK